jgi:general secretion pathway protein E
MGVEPFLLSSSLIGTIAQRLVRKLCFECREAYTASESEMQTLELEPDQAPVTIYRAKGCSKCNHLGYKGRIGIFEVVPIDNNMRQLIHDGVGEHGLEEQARNRSNSIKHNACSKVLTGETSLEEIIRVTQKE